MKLWLISANTSGYDVYSDAVVAAKTEKAAKEIHPGGYIWKGVSWAYQHTDGAYFESGNDSWDKPDNVIAELIGTAKPSTSPGVICASFHAG